MRNRTVGLAFLLVGVFLLSLPTAAQVFYPGSVDQKKAAEGAKVPKYDPHDLSGIWRSAGPRVPQPKDPRIGDAHATPLMGGAPPPPMTPWAQEIFDSRKPSAAESWQSRRVAPALGFLTKAAKFAKSGLMGARFPKMTSTLVGTGGQRRVGRTIRLSSTPLDMTREPGSMVMDGHIAMK